MKGIEMEDAVTMGQKIQVRRRAMGLRQRQLAEAASMSRSYLCDIEKDRGKNPSPQTLRSIAAALGVRPGFLLDGPHDSPRPENGVAAMRFDEV